MVLFLSHFNWKFGARKKSIRKHETAKFNDLNASLWWFYQNFPLTWSSFFLYASQPFSSHFCFFFGSFAMGSVKICKQWKCQCQCLLTFDFLHNPQTLANNLTSFSFSLQKLWLKLRSSIVTIPSSEEYQKILLFVFRSCLKTTNSKSFFFPLFLCWWFGITFVFWIKVSTDLFNWTRFIVIFFSFFFYFDKIFLTFSKLFPTPVCLIYIQIVEVEMMTVIFNHYLSYIPFHSGSFFFNSFFSITHTYIYTPTKIRFQMKWRTGCYDLCFAMKFSLCICARRVGDSNCIIRSYIHQGNNQRFSQFHFDFFFFCVFCLCYLWLSLYLDAGVRLLWHEFSFSSVFITQL